VAAVFTAALNHVTHPAAASSGTEEEEPLRESRVALHHMLSPLMTRGHIHVHFHPFYDTINGLNIPESVI